MAQSKGDHGTCETVVVKGVITNKGDHHKSAAKSESSEFTAKVSHGKETKADKKERLADEKQAKKDKKAEQDLEFGESSNA